MANKKLFDDDLRLVKYECNQYRNVEYVDDLCFIKCVM